MNPLIIIAIIILSVIADYYYLDVNKKIWGWMKNWSSRDKGIFFAGFIAVSLLVYFSLSLKYF